MHKTEELEKFETITINQLFSELPKDASEVRLQSFPREFSLFLEKIQKRHFNGSCEESCNNEPSFVKGE